MVAVAKIGDFDLMKSGFGWKKQKFRKEEVSFAKNCGFGKAKNRL